MTEISTEQMLYLLYTFAYSKLGKADDNYRLIFIPYLHEIQFILD